MNVNKIILAGRLVRDPALKFLPSNTQVVEFGMACNRKWKTPSGEVKEEACFVDVSAFGKTAEMINQHFTKGKEIYIEGRLHFSSWEDKQGGGKRSKLTVIAENFQFVGSNGGTGGGRSTDSSSSQDRPASRGPSQKPAQPEESSSFQEADIPFAFEGRQGQVI